ncbi:hypothetical protein [Sodaliphilus sp.]|uniref:hypothetical protein n=1 Tax=Sodaliphilus sp. TaxID=2815818 RepID=UPI00388EE8DF
MALLSSRSFSREPLLLVPATLVFRQQAPVPAASAAGPAPVLAAGPVLGPVLAVSPASIIGVFRHLLG